MLFKKTSSPRPLTSLGLLATLLSSVSLPQMTLAQSPAANPGISVNTLFLGRVGTHGAGVDAEAPDGFSLQEVELRYSSNIDPFFRGEFTLAIHPEHPHHEENGGGTEEEEHGGYTIEPEEAYVETLQIPYVTLRIGKFFSFFGRHNSLHTHSFPFIDAPLPHTEILGEEGLNEVGFAASYLLPTTWFSELILQAFSARNENLFGSEDPSNITGVAYFKNLWDLSDATTLELGAGAGSGRNAFDDKTEIYNATVSLKWRPVELGRYSSLTWTTEYLAADPKGDADILGKEGLSSWLMYQVGRNWWLQGRGEVLKVEAVDGTEEALKYSALVGYVPSEYSALRLQFDQIDHHEDQEQRVTLQWNMSMGAHPAHTY